MTDRRKWEAEVHLNPIQIPLPFPRVTTSLPLGNRFPSSTIIPQIMLPFLCFRSSFLALVTSICIDLVFFNCICIQFLSHHLNSSLLLTIKSHSATDQIWRCCLPRFDLIFEVNCVLQNAPLTEQQQFAIVSLSHAVSERPLPLKLVRFCHLHVIAILLNQFKCNSHL